MNKADMTKKLAEKANMTEEQATTFIQAFSETMADYFKKGEKVVLAEFGSFYIREDKSVQFNPSSKLRDQVG